jgi:hypothetical protein
MAPRKQSGPAGTEHGQNVKLHRKPTTHHSLRNGHRARADRRHAAVCRLLAMIKDPVITIGLAEGRAVGHSLLLAAWRSAALIFVEQRPDLVREPKQLAEEAALLVSGLLEVVDDAGSEDVEVDHPHRFARRLA